MLPAWQRSTRQTRRLTQANRCRDRQPDEQQRNSVPLRPCP